MPRYKELPPLRISRSLFNSVDSAVREHLRRAVYLPLILNSDPGETLRLEPLVMAVLGRVSQALRLNARKTSILTTLTEKQAKRISKGYNDSLKIGIEGWSKEEVKKLRADISTLTIEGASLKTIAKTIQDSYEVSAAKARELADQETSLLMARVRKEVYTDAGLTKYRWKCSPDNRVREMHKRLDGTIQDWKKPPVVDKQGNRKHPGEDYGCRCEAVPLLEVR